LTRRGYKRRTAIASWFKSESCRKWWIWNARAADKKNYVRIYIYIYIYEYTLNVYTYTRTHIITKGVLLSSGHAIRYIFTHPCESKFVYTICMCTCTFVCVYVSNYKVWYIIPLEMTKNSSSLVSKKKKNFTNLITYCTLSCIDIWVLLSPPDIRPDRKLRAGFRIADAAGRL
jgi:hypothetical protein